MGGAKSLCARLTGRPVLGGDCGGGDGKMPRSGVRGIGGRGETDIRDAAE